VNENFAANKADPIAWWHDLTARLAAGGVSYSESLAAEIIACVRSGEVNPLTVPQTILQLLKTTEKFAHVAATANANKVAAVTHLADTGAVTAAFDSELGRFLIANFIISDPGVELLLTQARRTLLMDFMRGGAAARSESGWRLLTSLAQHCFLTEYAYWEESDETLWIEVLAGNTEAMLADGDANADIAIALLGCYKPLVPWPGETLPTRAQLSSFDRHFHDMWLRLVDDRLQEIELAQTFRAIGGIDDPVSQAVRAQYEKNPYPRWRVPLLPRNTRKIPIRAGAYRCCRAPWTPEMRSSSCSLAPT
jgi:hypothetical protein